MCTTSREGHRSAVESINLGGHSISCDRPLSVLWRRRALLWIPQPPVKYVQGEVLGSRVCCVGMLLEDTATHPEYEADIEASESCRDNYLELKTKVEAFLKSFRSLEVGFCLGSIAAKAVIP
ncbi:hypothetical protein AVEN_123634-1 [Araneus ventricosus]|uniref:Uncharacterized protein n=1 Tax=Araneus ventricosus TaxID=182803 RepID=A0A4Y2GB12_ARAVE|nr:hypothetical protein AVEN_123634-1 [Araneus ventricosus]